MGEHDEYVADEQALRTREYHLLLARIDDQLVDARGGLDAIDELGDNGPGQGMTVSDAGLFTLEQLATTRDACDDAVRVLAVELLNRGAKSPEIATAAHTTPNTVYRWAREARNAHD